MVHGGGDDGGGVNWTVIYTLQLSNSAERGKERVRLQSEQRRRRRRW